MEINLAYTFLTFLLLLIPINTKPIEKDYGTDEQLSIKLENTYNEEKSNDIVQAKDLIGEPVEPSIDEKSGNKRSEEVKEISGDDTSGDGPKDSKEDVKVVANEKVEVGEKRDEFERGLTEDAAPITKQETSENGSTDEDDDSATGGKKSVVTKTDSKEAEKRSHKSSHKSKHTSEHSDKNEKKHDVKPDSKDSKKRNATVGGGWWNCGCGCDPGHHVEHQKEQHHEQQHHHQECAGCHGHHEKGHEQEHHDQHAHKEHGYELYEEWGEHAGKAHGHEGHHECCEQARHSHECEQVHDQGHGHKECCHQQQQCCHPNCCQVDIGSPCCIGFGKK